MSDEIKQKPKRKPGMGKSKGNGYESKIAKILANSLSPLKFIRTPGSGARLGGKNFEKFSDLFGEDAMKIFVGDVVPTNEKNTGVKFLHSVETKFYANQDTFTTLASGTANVYKWFEESVSDAKKIDKNPILIFKWNHTANFVAFDPTHPLAPTVELKPKFSLVTHGEVPRTLNIYVLEDLLKFPDFWIQKL